MTIQELGYVKTDVDKIKIVIAGLITQCYKMQLGEECLGEVGMHSYLVGGWVE